MGWYGIKINRNDSDFSLYIRTRDNWHCVYGFKCNRYEDFRNNKGRLSNSHFQKRGKWTVRYDPENCDSACTKCHFFVENDPNGQRVLEDFKKRQLGERSYKLLLIRANTTGRRDDKLTALYVKQLLKEQKLELEKQEAILN